MVEFKENFKGKNVDNLCPMCNSESDPSEHIFVFNAYGDDCGKISLNDIVQNDNVEKIKKSIDFISNRLVKRSIVI